MNLLTFLSNKLTLIFPPSAGFLGRNDRSYRVPRGARGGLRTNSNPRYQESVKIPKQSETGESVPSL